MELMLILTVPMDYVSLVYKSIKMDGFLVSDYYKEWYTGLHQMRDWILEVRQAIPHKFIIILNPTYFPFTG